MQEEKEIVEEPKPKTEWRDGDEYKESIRDFLKYALKKINSREAYNSMTEIHFSGGSTADFGKIRDGAGILSVEILYENDNPTKIHARLLDDSDMDIYISGRAIEDWKKKYLEQEKGARRGLSPNLQH